ncbi:MAG: UDP-N-acetylmuramate dehydrogenase [Chitinophagaceae bacterium]|nr:UDP-N-acetylmuramate dehydrogenase [Chitinophagaceae bacterium]
MQIQQNFSLKPYNTFGINVQAAYFSNFASLDELAELTEFCHKKNKLPQLVLGGGSNVLFTQDFRGIILKNELKGIDLIKEDLSYYYVKSAAGEDWHRFVLFCIDNNYAGVENLSLIPGNVGASPIQNIGAYGVETKDVFHELEAWHLQDKKLVTFAAEDCKFAYRDSVFKTKYKGQYVITSVTFRLLKQPVYQTNYGAIEQELTAMGITELSIKAISDAVIKIRKSKLPDPEVIGNAGSFFKNPTIPASRFESLKITHPTLPGYPAVDDLVKIPAGWLIEQCGWKGYRKGDAGCHEKQALVLVNYRNASGIDIYTLSNEIMHSVETTFGILLEREVNII